MEINGLGRRSNESKGRGEREDEGEVGGSGRLVIQEDSIKIIHLLWVNDDDGDGYGDDDSDGEEENDDDGEGDGDRE